MRTSFLALALASAFWVTPALSSDTTAPTDPMLDTVPPPQKFVSTWQEAIGWVRSRSTDVRSAYADVAKAAALSRSALGAALPSLNGVGSGTHQFLRERSSPPQDVLAGSLQASMPLLDLRAWHQIGTAHRGEDVAELSLLELKRGTILNLAGVLVNVVVSEQLSELNRVGLRNALERLELTRRRQALGAATGLDRVRAEQDVAASRATLVTGDETLRKAREALGLAVGYPEAIGVARDFSLDTLEASAQRLCQATDVAHRTDARVAEARQRVAQRNVDNVALQFLPTVTVQSTLATTSAPAVPDTTWNLVGLLTVPIWDGGLKYGALRSNRADRDRAEQQSISVRRTAEVQIAQAERGVRVAEQSLAVATKAAELAKESDLLVRTSFKEGQGTSLELVVAAAALREAQITKAVREYDLIRARVGAVVARSNCSF